MNGFSMMARGSTRRNISISSVKAPEDVDATVGICLCMTQADAGEDLSARDSARVC